MKTTGGKAGSDIGRVLVFLLLLALAAGHAAAWRALQALAGRAPAPPADCRLADRGVILCLDEAGETYRAP